MKYKYIIFSLMTMSLIELAMNRSVNADVTINNETDNTITASLTGTYWDKEDHPSQAGAVKAVIEAGKSGSLSIPSTLKNLPLHTAYFAVDHAPYCSNDNFGAGTVQVTQHKASGNIVCKFIASAS